MKQTTADKSLVEQLQSDVIDLQKVNLSNAIEVSGCLSKTEIVFEKLSRLYHVERDPVTGQIHNYIGGANGNIHA